MNHYVEDIALVSMAYPIHLYIPVVLLKFGRPYLIMQSKEVIFLWIGQYNKSVTPLALTTLINCYHKEGLNLTS